MTETPRLSLIVPIYNVAPYLRATLDSIRKQSFTSWEALLVDDGSKDESGKIMEEYVKLDDRFRAFHKANEGVNTARMMGLENARGEYLSFMDGDDILPIHALEKMVTALKENGADIAVGQQAVTFESNPDIEKISNTLMPIPQEYSKPFTWHDLDFCYMYLSIWLVVFGNKVFKRSLWKDVVFPPHLRMAEDQIVIKQVLLNSKRLIVIPDCVYIYKKRPGSATTKRGDGAFDVFTTYRLMTDLFKVRGIYDAEYSRLNAYFYITFMDHMRYHAAFRLWPKFVYQAHTILKSCQVDRLKPEGIPEDTFHELKAFINGKTGVIVKTLLAEYARVVATWLIKGSFKIINRYFPKPVKTILRKAASGGIRLCVKGIQMFTYVRDSIC